MHLKVISATAKTANVDYPMMINSVNATSKRGSPTDKHSNSYARALLFHYTDVG
ncbi:hypothetical protein HNW13_020095 [Shewanella sp. BF02_Schw]|uniref:hypothetical protein n=1 Tax=unclassified Shewanella TaxID=196818 RepID=UPI0017825655|nr:hypothetical protein [Shewanella sp. BF02_Schw]MBO1898046.1 hypothetical protein [Shewanella sp. BF02_Schw]